MSVKFRLLLLLLSVTYFTKPAVAEETQTQSKKIPQPLPLDLANAIIDSPNPPPINMCNPNLPQDLEQDCAEDPLHYYQRKQIEGLLIFYEEQVKKGLPFPENCNCPKNRDTLSDLQNPLQSWRDYWCLERCEKLISTCDLSLENYNRKTCIKKFLGDK